MRLIANRLLLWLPRSVQVVSARGGRGERSLFSDVDLEARISARAVSEEPGLRRGRGLTSVPP